MRKIIIAFMFFVTADQCLAQLAVKNLLLENSKNPLSIDIAAPRFSWQIAESIKQNVMQSAYEIRVSVGDFSKERKKTIWSSGKIESDQSQYVKYNGVQLKSGERYFWQVKIWDNFNRASAWSEVAWWQMGMLKSTDWTCKWIIPGFTDHLASQPSPLFRKTFYIGKKVRSAIIYITAHGLYEAYINGQRVGDTYLNPGWTSYNKRLQYQAYEVTSFLKKGRNALGVLLGSGWYRG